MDLPRFLAEYLHEETGLRAEAYPSRADIKADHFIVMIDNFWSEPGGTFQNVTAGDFTFEQFGVPVEGFDQALPMRVVWRSNCTGENWRADMIERARKNAIFFSAPFLVPALGGKLTGTAADMMDDGQGVDVPDLDDWNVGSGLGFVAGFKRDPARDRVFTPFTKGKRQLRNGFLAEQHFIGAIFFKGGAEVPNDMRRHV